MLIVAGIDVKNMASYKGNVLSILISGNYALEIDDLKEIVSFFLKKGIDINSSDKLGNNILKVYLERPDSTEDGVNFLIQSGVNINHTCLKGLNALMWYSSNNSRVKIKP
jgi:hypothetical protein